MYKSFFKRIVPIWVAVLLLINNIPFLAFGQDGDQMIINLGTSEQINISSFSPIRKEISYQTVPIGTEIENLVMPSSIAALSDDETQTINIPVLKWESDVLYQPDQVGVYHFKPIFAPEYFILNDVEPPVVSVHVTSVDLSSFDMQSGTNYNPVLIGSSEQLAEFADLVNTGRIDSYFGTDDIYAELTSNIDLSDYSTSGWLPIGTSESPFKGNFDGKGFIISNLYINEPTIDNIGFFGVLDGALVQNIALTDVFVLGFDNTGALAGQVKSESLIQSVYTTGIVSSSGKNLGGIAGVSSGIIRNSYSLCNTGYSDKVVGVGGLVGSLEGDLENCYAVGSVWGNSDVGGLVGSVSFSGSISNSVALNPSVTAAFGDFGRVAGSNSGTLGQNLAFDLMALGSPETNSGTASATISGGTETDNNGLPISSTTLNDDGTVGGLFDLPSWNVQSGFIPTLSSCGIQSGEMPFHLLPLFFQGSGTSSDPFLISKPQQLVNFAYVINNGIAPYDKVGQEFLITNDIDLSSLKDKWIPVGIESNFFQGVLDGGGHTISNLVLIDMSASNGGLFGNIKSGTIKNLILKDIDISVYGNAGGLSGAASDSSVTNTHIEGKITSTSGKGGGITGSASNLTISSSSTKTTVKANTFAGGLVGEIESGNIKNSLATGSTFARIGDAGGIAGKIVTTDISKSFTTGFVSGNRNAGGLVGSIEKFSNVKLSYSYSNVSSITNNAGGVAGAVVSDSFISDVYNTGNIYSRDGNSGGLVGYADGVITKSYSISSVSSSNGSAGGIAGKLDTTNGKITFTAALNKSIDSGFSFGKIVASNENGSLDNNYSFSGISINGTVFNNKIINNKDGESLPANELQSIAFWQNSMTFDSSLDWDVSDGKLPILQNLSGQDSEAPFLLTRFPLQGEEIQITPLDPIYPIDMNSRKVTLESTGMEQWTYSEIVWTVSPENIDLTPDTVNGKVSVIIPANFGGEITVTATNPNSNKFAVTKLSFVDFYSVTVASGGNGSTYTSTSSAPAGQAVILTAVSDMGYHFSHWDVLGDDMSLSGQSTSFIMPAKNIQLVALFEQNLPNTYTIDISIDGGGSVVSSASVASASTFVDLLAVPSSGFQFKEWQVLSNGFDLSSNEATNFVMPSVPVHIKAVFERVPEKIYSIDIAPSSNGSIVLGSSGATEGSMVSANAVPDFGYRFKQWLVLEGDIVLPKQANVNFLMPASNIKLQAIFEATNDLFDINVIQNNGGFVSVNYISANSGEIITLSAIPESGYQFSRWEVLSGEITLPSELSTSFTMPSSNVSIRGIFTLISADTKPQIKESNKDTIELDKNPNSLPKEEGRALKSSEILDEISEYQHSVEKNKDRGKTPSTGKAFDSTVDFLFSSVFSLISLIILISLSSVLYGYILLKKIRK